MKIIAKSKNGYLADLTVDELNLICGLTLDKYGIENVIDVESKLKKVVDIASKETQLKAKIAAMKLALEEL